ncbi:hypothetical protein [Bosea sp. AS-1]|uniref:hypothetical protein n=1 Tax=Bosea sp. AS-1 TaxID=2015316 RepID=UPI000B77BE8F|nr:hypothetical protein [Bosea sp. AS-1]
MRAVAVALSCLLSLPASAAGPFGKIVVGNWSGGTFTNDTTGAFSHCAVSARYKSGVTMLTSVTAQFSWLLGFSKPDWTLRTGETLKLRLVFDRSSTIDVVANIKSPTLLTIAMPAQSALIDAFRKGRYLELVANDARYTFALTSTGEMLPALVECVKQSGNVRGPISPGAPAEARANPQATEKDKAARAEKKALLEKTRDLISGKMLACIGREGASMLLTDEKAEVVAKAAMLFCKSDVDALTNATIELIENEEGRPANRSAVREAAEKRVQEVVTAHVIRTRGNMLNKRVPPGNSVPSQPSDPASRPSQML